MKKIALILLASCFTLFVNGQTKAKSKKSGKDTPQSTTSAGEVKIKYRVVIAFTSIGSGIDGAKHDEIEAFIKKHAKKPVYDVIKMGREGERDICLTLKELTKDEQITFIDEIKKLAQGSDRVKVTENSERVKKQ